MGYETIQEDIRFTDDTNKLILDPLKIESEFDANGAATFRIYNGGVENFSNLGIYVQPTSILGLGTILQNSHRKVITKIF